MNKDSFGFQQYLEKLCPDELCPDDLINRRVILFDILKAMPNDIDSDFKKGGIYRSDDGGKKGCKEYAGR